MKIAVLLSGGVDSSVTLKLLQGQGHEVTAFYVKIWLEDELSYLGNCPWEEDLKYARAVCEKLGVKLEVISLQKEYWKEVVAYSIRELKAGRTPNPDILCNRKIKFGEFIKKLNKNKKKYGVFDRIASGHYANIVNKNGTAYLEISPDKIKDQTYFLAYLSQKQLRKIIFPVGKYDKKEVRALAKKFDLPNKDRKDSQGICFLGNIRYSDFVKHHLGIRHGDLINGQTGGKMGTHDGFWYYTIGQRQGIKLSGGPWYVVGKNVEKNIIYIGGKDDLPTQSSKEIKITEINWLTGRPPKKRTLGVRIRHTGEIYPAKIILNRGGGGSVLLEEGRYDAAPGQFAVFYDGARCLGGGVIK